jgi:hypothetical protein
MGRGRSAYADKIEALLGGAIREHYKSCLTSRLRLGLAAHWAAEASRIVHNELVDAVDIPIRGFKHRGDAFMQAVKEVQANDARYHARAETEVRRDYELSKLKIHVDDRDTNAFWVMVHGAIGKEKS